MRCLPSLIVLLHVLGNLLPALQAAEEQPPVHRVLPAGARPDDARLGAPRTLRDAYHPWTPAGTKEAWSQQAQAIRERVLVSNGLWPMPPKTPLNASIHGRIERDDYTIEKVYFESHPGHFVTGNLYRPKQLNGKAPGVLCPHGHWPKGRFHDAGDKGAEQQIAQKAEEFLSGAHHPVQARMVQLARMGCVVFHYDMVGYADSQQIAHRVGFTDVAAGMWLQDFMGLQTWNSIRSLDFLLSLPDVDPNRIGVTGSSGGGTQTFMLTAVDDRPHVAFPAVMVSTAMQGGCICENATYLRIGINNIALAALFAPKPQAMSGANDWTIDIESKGLPELKQVYALFGKEDLVHAKAYPQFGHNYNQVAREMMYEWFNTHLNLGKNSPIKERDFEPVPPEQLSVFDNVTTLPEMPKGSEPLRAYLTDVSRKQLRELTAGLKTDAGLQEYRRTIGTAARVMLDDGVPPESQVEATLAATEKLAGGDIQLMKGTIGRTGSKEQIPLIMLQPGKASGRAVLWISEAGKSHLFDANGQPEAQVQRLLESGVTVASIDPFLTGEFTEDGKSAEKQTVDSGFFGYTFGYNRPLVSNRVRDILTAIAFLKKNSREVALTGTGQAGSWTLLAAAVAGENLSQVVIDTDGFQFEDIAESSHPMFLPGALRYGGLSGFVPLIEARQQTLAGMAGQTEPKKSLQRKDVVDSLLEKPKN